MADDTLAQRIRAAHPGAYDDLSDQALEAAIDAKFPGAYDDIPRSAPSGMSRFVSNAAERLNPVTMATGVIQAVANPIDTVKAIAGQHAETFDKAKQAFSEGRYSEAAGYGAASALPVLGPMAAEIGEQAASGDVAGAAGALVGTIAPMAVARPAGVMARRAAKPLRESAERKVVQALGPTKERFKAIAERRAPDILQRRLGGSRDSMQTQAQAKVAALGQQIDETLQQHGGQLLSTQPIIDALEESKSAFQVTRQMPLAEAMRSGAVNAPGAKVVGQTVDVPVVFEPRAITQLDELQSVIRQLGSEARVDQLVAIRRGWDKVVADAGGYAHRRSGGIGQPLRDISEASIKRDATAAIRQLLNEEVPDLATLNKEYAFWKDLGGVLRQTQQRTQPHGPGLSSELRKAAGQVVGSAMGSAGGYAVGGGMGAAFGAVAVPIITGAIAKTAHAVFTSPRWRFVSARTRARIADALASGNTEQLSVALGEAAAVTGGGDALTRLPVRAEENREDRVPARVTR